MKNTKLYSTKCPNKTKPKRSKSQFGLVHVEEVLTESSCVRGLGEIFWHFSVDIESEEGKKGTKKKERKGREREKKEKT